jgi:two-component system, sensor histidine kinase and response regulator
LSNISVTIALLIVLICSGIIHTNGLTMNFLQNFFSSIAHIGFDESLAIQEQTRIKNINLLSFVGSITGLTYVYLGRDSLPFALGSMLYIMGMMLIFLLHWKKYYDSAMVYLVALSCITYTFFAIGFGNTLGTEYYLVVAFLLTQHQLKVSKYTHFNTGLILTSLLTILYINRAPFTYFSPPHLAPLFLFVNVSFSIFSSIIIIIRFRLIMEGYQQDIEEKNFVLEEQKAALFKSNQTKDKLFSIIGHDIKGPILGVKTLLNIMQAMPLNDREPYFDKLDKSLETTHSTLENLLDWASQQKQSQQLYRQKIFLKPMVQDIFLLFRQTAQQKEIALIESIAPETYINANHHQVAFILRNLVANALKFTHKGGHITVNAKDVQLEYVEISVQDNGVGIEKHNLDKLFLIEERFTTQGTAKEKGTGLGLTLCKEFVEQNQGRIYIESEKDKGSTFYVQLKQA